MDRSGHYNYSREERKKKKRGGGGEEINAIVFVIQLLDYRATK